MRASRNRNAASFWILNKMEIVAMSTATKVFWSDLLFMVVASGFKFVIPGVRFVPRRVGFVLVGEGSASVERFVWCKLMGLSAPALRRSVNDLEAPSLFTCIGASRV